MKLEDLKSLESLLKERDPKEDGLKKKDIWYDKYESELLDYHYIHNVEDFKKLDLGGIIKPIDLKEENLKSGGLVVKIDKTSKNKYYALVRNKQFALWKIYFDGNYIFYRKPYSTYKNDDKTKRFTNIMDKFVAKDEVNKYQTESNPVVEELFNEYKKNKK
jgi:hypothetical protein